jgi:hypothetical protein
MSFIKIADYRQTTSSPLAILQQTWRLEADQKIKGITVVSAFTDPIIIKQLLNEIDVKRPPKKLIRILLDFGQSRYNIDKEITKQLNLLSNKLRKDFHKNSGIFLIKLGRFLHSKIIILHSQDGDKVSIGSLNFTTRAFLSNEEVLININTKKEILDANEYIDKLIADNQRLKIPFKKLTEEFGSYREWLMHGVLFYEDKDASPFNFKLGIPPELLKQPSFIIPNADAEVADNLSVMQLLGIPREKQVLPFKKYCIHTCYGYWCPSQLIDIARAKIKETVITKTKSKIEPILDNTDNFIKIVHTHINEIEERIIKFNSENKTEYRWDKQGTINRIDKRIPRILEKLKDDDNLFRLLAGVYETTVPDLWAGDEIALREFEESFCSHIVLELSKTRVQNWLAQWLREFEFSDLIRLGTDWDSFWDDEEAWLEWLPSQSTDPFKELPKAWELK